MVVLHLNRGNWDNAQAWELVYINKVIVVDLGRVGVSTVDAPPPLVWTKCTFLQYKMDIPLLKNAKSAPKGCV